MVENQGEQKRKASNHQRDVKSHLHTPPLFPRGARYPGAGPCHSGMAESDGDLDVRLLVHREHGWPRPHWTEKPMRPENHGPSKREGSECSKIHTCFIKCLLLLAINPQPQDPGLRSNLDGPFSVLQHTKMQCRCVICFISQHCIP